jgi:hypothetical protein
VCFACDTSTGARIGVLPVSSESEGGREVRWTHASVPILAVLEIALGVSLLSSHFVHGDDSWMGSVRFVVSIFAGLCMLLFPGPLLLLLTRGPVRWLPQLFTAQFAASLVLMMLANVVRSPSRAVAKTQWRTRLRSAQTAIANVTFEQR